MTAGDDATIVDAVFAQTREGCYRLTRVHHIAGRVLRVDVDRDYYPFQSHARAEILAPSLTWTVLAYVPPAEWHRQTPVRHADAGTLAPIANLLLERALRILPASP
ncbi:hypothetical protein [Cryptosporangium phraense]|uniref:Uncharacterized protein n=1 Tax=Cryptosporangium phraense TaxID=2593070 RepID=A0A545ANC3_9ACTN|nr:hypothetical protein [Cryptosporangium phraense]TQS42827.1 hypothetical protein FL583_22510 [Cryptosporangium phraense]